MPAGALLVVDDLEQNLTVFKRVIEKCLPGHEVVVARSGEEALELAEANDFEGALVDYQMPGMDGIELCRRLKAGPTTGRVPIILVTGYGAKGNIKAQGLEAGADDFIAKPFDNNELIARVKVMLRIKKAEDELREANTKLGKQVANVTSDLKEQERSLATTVRSMGEALVTTNREGRISSLNPVAERLLACASSEAVGQPLEAVCQLLDAQGQERGTALLSTAIAEPRVVEIEEEVRLETRDGRSFPVEGNVAAIRGEPGENPGGVVLVLRDITERKRIQNELLRLNQDLEDNVAKRTSELRSINDELEAFCYSVSHDLREPLRAINGFGRILQEDYAKQLDADARDMLSRVCKASSRMGHLIDDLLTLSRVTRGDIMDEPVDLSRIAHEIMEDLRVSEPERKVEVRVADGLKTRGDPALLRLLLENLLGNAWKYTGTKSRATIELGADPTDGQTTFFVRDNGVGFNPAYSGKLFKAFQRLHSAKDFAGTGVGLATVKRIVHRHGGRVWADGEEGKGALFCFTLKPAQNGE